MINADDEMPQSKIPDSGLKYPFQNPKSKIQNQMVVYMVVLVVSQIGERDSPRTQRKIGGFLSLSKRFVQIRGD